MQRSGPLMFLVRMSPAGRVTLLSGVVLTVLLHTAVPCGGTSGIRCHQCDSIADPDTCADPFDSTRRPVLPSVCDRTTPRRQLCVKRVQRSNVTGGGGAVPVVTRGCISGYPRDPVAGKRRMSGHGDHRTPERASHGHSWCKEESGAGQLQGAAVTALNCYCNYDECNGEDMNGYTLPPPPDTAAIRGEQSNGSSCIWPPGVCFIMLTILMLSYCR